MDGSTGIVLGTIFYLIFCGVVGYLGEQRGRTPFTWFLLAIFLSPLVAGVILLVKPVERGEQEAKARKIRHVMEADEQRWAQEAQAVVLNTDDFIGRLEKLNKLRSYGVLSDDQHQVEKAKLLDELSSKELDSDSDDFLYRLILLVENGVLSRDEFEDMRRTVESKRA